MKKPIFAWLACLALPVFGQGLLHFNVEPIGMIEHGYGGIGCWDSQHVRSVGTWTGRLTDFDGIQISFNAPAGFMYSVARVPNSELVFSLGFGMAGELPYAPLLFAESHLTLLNGSTSPAALRTGLSASGRGIFVESTFQVNFDLLFTGWTATLLYDRANVVNVEIPFTGSGVLDYTVSFTVPSPDIGQRMTIQPIPEPSVGLCMLVVIPFVLRRAKAFTS